MILAKEGRSYPHASGWSISGASGIPPMTNCGGRYAPGYRRLACPPSMACRSPIPALVGPASCAAVP
jgi:hypothetical protein